MSNSFMTAYPMGMSPTGPMSGSKSPTGPMSGSKNIGTLATAGAPLQPTLPRKHRSDDVVEHESTGVQCPSAEVSKKTLVH